VADLTAPLRGPDTVHSRRAWPSSACYTGQSLLLTLAVARLTRTTSPTCTCFVRASYAKVTRSVRFMRYDAVDALVVSRTPLPPAEERKRLRREWTVSGPRSGAVRSATGFFLGLTCSPADVPGC
jgi:hypothetical protein